MFADLLSESIERSNSRICAGLDPVLDSYPKFVLEEARHAGVSAEDIAFSALTTHAKLALEAVASRIAAIKPNLAFYEQYGMAGMRAYAFVRDLARAHKVPCIADAKRGDIGSTAAAYSTAFLGKSTIFERPLAGLEADAVTVNPFLGFDSLEPFVERAAAHGKGIFVLVKTSNPGSADFQSARDAGGVSVSEKVARWIEKNSAKLQGRSGWSGLGAVVGATHPPDLKSLRSLMPRAYFLIPGMGAQGAAAADTVNGFGFIQKGTPGGAVVNVSRGLFGDIPPDVSSSAELIALLKRRLDGFNNELNGALAGSGGSSR